jgi:pumilio homology domain family member 6
MSMAHDTCRVIECLIQYGNEVQRNGVFDELRDNFVELSKSKYARFLIKKLLKHCDKAQKDHVIKSFFGNVTKLIKHSYACQIIEIIFNEYASFSQRNQMLMEFYDTTFAIFNDQRYKTLKDVIEAQPQSKDKILENLKAILSKCVNKTLLMFSIIHRVFVEFFQNCDPKDYAEMINLLSEHLVHMVHTKDGTTVAMQCIWFGTAKDRKKIIKSFKTFILKIALEEHGHLILLSIFDSVDDTKFVAKAVIEELFRSVKELFDNEYGRKVITYLLAPRDTRFFLKDLIKRLEVGDKTDTSKKNPELRKRELFDYAKPFLKEFLNKEIESLLSNGASGILVPIIVSHLGIEGDDLIKSIADCLLKKKYDEIKEGESEHCIVNATTHFIIKQLLAKDQERREKSSLSSLFFFLLFFFLF